MSQLYTVYHGFNPYHVDVNGKTYLVSNIILYKKDNIIASTGHGWFGIGDNHVPILVIPTVILRRKPKLDGETFIIVKKRDVFHQLDKYSNVDLYIPFEYFNFELIPIEEPHGYYSYVYPNYVSKKNNQIYFVNYNGRVMIEDESKKAYAEVLLATINGIESELDILKEEYNQLDDSELLKKIHYNNPPINTMAAVECKQIIVKSKHYFKL